MKIKISVIMPCLNMIKYIEQCLDSVVNQTIKDIEILIIDAGSTDGTLEIINRYSKRDQRIKLLHSNQKSYGYQVNMGIMAARGEYIGIVDTDDEMASDMYEVLYKTAEESGADYVKGTAKGFYTLCNGGRYCYPIAPFDLEEYGNGIEISPKQTPSLLPRDNFLWYGLYKTSLIKQIKMHESPGAAFQDMGALFQIQIKAEKAYYIAKPVYYYRQDNMNASTHNHKGFSFIEKEYSYAEHFLDSLPVEWYTVFYFKEFLHFMDRMYVMAVSGNFWEDTLEDMLRISEKLYEAYQKGHLKEKDLSDEQWMDLLLLWKHPRLLYEKYKDIYETKKEFFVKVIRHLENASGIIFGSGYWGEYLHAQLLYRGNKNIAAYCDNDVKQQGTYKHDVKILSPEQAVDLFPEGKYIIANKRNAKEIKRQLISLGIQERDILVYSIEIDYYLFGMSLV